MDQLNKTPFTDKELNDLRGRLEDKQERIQEELIRLEEKELPTLHKGEEANDGYGDDAKTDQIRQRLVARVKRRRIDLAEINAALVRMEDGSYGLDERTGEPIRIERLQALPTARTKI